MAVQGFVDLAGFANDVGQLELIHFNIRSIRKNSDELLIYLNELDLKKLMMS